jgi:hypothetical protein
MAKVKTVYGVYKGEEFLDVGTMAELAERFDVDEVTVQKWASPTNHKRAVNKDGLTHDRTVAVRLDKVVFEYSEGGPTNGKTRTHTVT